MSSAIGSVTSCGPSALNADSFGKIRLVSTGNDWFDHVVDVDMDQYKVITGEGCRIGTWGLVTCFAVCMRGKTNKGIPVLGLFHTTHADPIEDVFKMLNTAMIDKGCVRQSIEVFVVGGLPPSENNSAGTGKEQAEVLALQYENIQGTRFNISENEEDPVNVVLTSDGLFVSKKDLYEHPEAEL